MPFNSTGKKIQLEQKLKCIRNVNNYVKITFPKLCFAIIAAISNDCFQHIGELKGFPIFLRGPLL